MFDVKQRIGLIYQDRMYVLEFKYCEDKGILNYLPFGVAANADFIIDLTTETMLKHRFEMHDEWVAIGGFVASQMFNSVEIISMDGLIETEDRFAKAKTFEASKDNIFTGE